MRLSTTELRPYQPQQVCQGAMEGWKRAVISCSATLAARTPEFRAPCSFGSSSVGPTSSACTSLFSSPFLGVHVLRHGLRLRVGKGQANLEVQDLGAHGMGSRGRHLDQENPCQCLTLEYGLGRLQAFSHLPRASRCGKPPAFQKPMLEAMAPTDLLRLDPMPGRPSPASSRCAVGVLEAVRGPLL